MRDAFTYQPEALRIVSDENTNLLVVAPTGAGKTKVGVAALRKSGRGIYVCPTRTLCYEKRNELAEEFGHRQVRVSNRDYPMSRREFKDTPIRVMTPFKLLDFLNNVQDFSKHAPVIVLDEIDSMDFQVEIIYALVLALHPDVRIIALSGTINEKDIPRLQNWLGGESGCRVINSSVRPKDLLFWTCRTSFSASSGFDQQKCASLLINGPEPKTLPLQVGAQPIEIAATVALFHELRTTSCEPMLIWSPRRYFAGTVFQAIVKSLVGGEVSGEARGEIERRMAGLPSAQGWASARLREGLPMGIGLHHGGLLPEEQRLVEDLSREGKLLAVVGCLGMCRGIHHPFGHVILPTVRDPAVPVGSPLIDISQFHQVSGRAGRVGFGSDAPGNVWVVCRNAVDQVEVEEVLLKHRASQIETRIDNRRSLTTLLASLIMGDHGQRFRRRDSLLHFLQGLYSAADYDTEQREELLDFALSDFRRFHMIEERPFGYWLTNGGERAARLGVHPRELLAIEALCDESFGTVPFETWVELLAELYPELVDTSTERGSATQALGEVQRYGLTVYSVSGVSNCARPMADYVQRMLDRTQAYFAMMDTDPQWVQNWRTDIYYRFLFGNLQTIWALTGSIYDEGRLRRLVRSLGRVVEQSPGALGAAEHRQIANCLYADGYPPADSELERVATALEIEPLAWRSIITEVIGEEVLS